MMELMFEQIYIHTDIYTYMEEEKKSESTEKIKQGNAESLHVE